MHNTVSIIVPLHNRAELVPQTIQSVLDQTYPHWELIVVDDGSTDGSDAVVQAYAEQDGRIRFCSRDRAPKGAPACRNIGLEKSTGSYVIFLDSDDVLAPWCLAERVKTFGETPHFDFLVFPALLFTEQPGDSPYLFNTNNITDDLEALLKFDYPFQTASPIFKRSALPAKAFWNENLYNKQDWELFIRLILEGKKYKKIDALPDFFFRYGHGTGSLGRNDSIDALRKRTLLLNEVVAGLADRKLIEPYKNAFLPTLYAHAALLIEKGNRKEGFYFWQQLKKKIALQGVNPGLMHFTLVVLGFCGVNWFFRVQNLLRRAGLLMPYAEDVQFMKCPIEAEKYTAVTTRLAGYGTGGHQSEKSFATPTGQRFAAVEPPKSIVK